MVKEKWKLSKWNNLSFFFSFLSLLFLSLLLLSSEAIVNVNGIATNKRRCKTSECRGKTCVKKIKGNFLKKKVHDDIPSVKNVNWKKTKREVELVDSVIANMKTNSESEDVVG